MGCFQHAVQLEIGSRAVQWGSAATFAGKGREKTGSLGLGQEPGSRSAAVGDAYVWGAACVLLTSGRIAMRGQGWLLGGEQGRPETPDWHWLEKRASPLLGP